jgi:sugar phosphate isomerase/epimerase
MSSALSLGYLTLPGASSAEVIEAAAAALLTRVGLRVAGRTPVEFGNWLVRDRTRQREIATLLADTGVKVLDVTAYQIATGTTAADFLPVFDAASVLGARFVWTTGFDPDPARLADTFAILAETAGRLGLVLALEPVPYSHVRTLADANRILDRAPARSAAILLDLMHFVRGGGNAAELARTPAGRIGFVQICDGAAAQPAPHRLVDEARKGRLLPGEGAFPIREILAALRADVDLEIEVPHAGLAMLPARERAIICANTIRMYLDAPR